MIRTHHLIVLLGLAVPLLPSCAPPSTGAAARAQIAAIAPGTARVWFMRTTDPEEQFGDPIIYANGSPVGRSQPGIAFYHDFPPGNYVFTVQSYDTPTRSKDKVQLAPGTQTYLEVFWGGSWFVGTAGGETFFVRTLSPQLGQAYLGMLTEVGPARAF
jgi:hypothetical protein